jgi:hypothetical protein
VNISPARRGGLEIVVDPAFQEREWMAERVGWTLMAVIVAAALLGLLGGPGPLSRVTMVTPDGAAALHYDRFAQVEAPMSLQLQMRAAGASGDTVVWMAADYAHALHVQAVTPEPESMAVGGGRVTYRFELTDLPATVTFVVRAQRSGVLSGAVGVGSGPPLRFWQLVYP